MPPSGFEFADRFGDARMEELRLLSAADRSTDGLHVNSVPNGPWRELLISLVWRGLLGTFSYDEVKSRHARSGGSGGDIASSSGIPGESVLEREITKSKVWAACRLYESGSGTLYLTHAGRVRLSELKQTLRTGREREPFGILWDTRHWEQDLQVAILESCADSPLAVAYLDMNGLKQVNDTAGHDAGDLAIKTYFQGVAAALGDRGQAYRLAGDEVLVVLPKHDVEAAVKIINLACKKLMSERLDSTETIPMLSIAAGIVTTDGPSASPTDLRAAADKIQYEAKNRSRQSRPRPSVIAAEGLDEMIIIEHDSIADETSRVTGT